MKVHTALVALGWCAGMAACGPCDTGPVRDTRGFVKARIELSGDLMAGGAATISDGARTALAEVWTERLKRLRKHGTVVVDGARLPPELQGEAGFHIVVDIRVPPPCEPAVTLETGRQVWEILSNRGDFGVHTIDDDLRGDAATFLRALEAVQDVTTASSHRGLLVVKLVSADAAAAVTDRLGVYLAALNGFAVRVPEGEVSPGKPDPTRLFLAVVKDPPVLDGTSINSAEASPERDGFTQVSVTFRDAAVPTLAALTEKHLGRHVLVLHDVGEFLAAPVIGTVVRDGRWTLRLPTIIGPNRAESLASVLGAGTLPAAPVLKQLRHGCVRDNDAVDWVGDASK